MLNQLLKFTLVSSVLLWLRPRWRGLLALTVFVVLVHVFHSEYLGYVELSEDKSFLVASYFVKWLSLLAGLVLYYLFAIAGLQIGGAQAGDAGTAVTNDTPTESPGPAADDGFDFLREKKSLESRADKLLDGHRPDR